MNRPLALRLIVISAILVALAGVYYAVDPAHTAWMPRCPLKMMTGLSCPGCGSQRLLHALLHGDLAGAWQANALMLVMLPVIVAGVWLELVRERHPRLYMRVHSPALIIGAGVVLAGWGILRNVWGV